MGCDKNSTGRNLRILEFQSTQPEWAATLLPTLKAASTTISIHAARVGCDWRLLLLTTLMTQISIHAARVGCDKYGYEVVEIIVKFQSTQPEWAATFVHNSHIQCQK